MTPQSKKKWLDGSKDIILFLISTGAIAALVHIWETPAKLEKLADRVTLAEAFASTIDKKQAVMESNLENQTKLINMMQQTQSRMWDKINSRYEKINS